MSPLNPDDAAWFDRVRTTLEEAYTAHDAPWRQSGMSGPAARWEALRRPVADAMDRSGAFLDVGCANGYLMECCARWAAERGLEVEPYGLDLSEALVALARARLPRWEARFWVGNALTWAPPRRFDIVRTELVYVPSHLERAYLDRLLSDVLVPGGQLLVAHYSERSARPEREVVPGSTATSDLLGRLATLGYQPERWVDGDDPKGRRITRVAVLRA